MSQRPASRQSAVAAEATVSAAPPRRAPRAPIVLLLLPILLLTPVIALLPGRQAHAAGPAMTGLRVQGNRIVNGAGQPVRLLGVNRSGSEYACAQGWGIFEGPTDAAAIQAMTSWGITAVRVPLNESCWLGINGVPAAYGGPNYQNAIRDYVARLNAAGLAVILDLHWSAPGAQRALEQQPMPNRDHSVEFWRQVATTFKGHSSVVFDLFNEPIPDNNRDTAEAWRCWRDGGTCAGLNYQAAGMQELVNAVRGTGATNVIMLGGVQYAARLSRWLAHKPNDPTGNLAAAWHVYNFSWCADQACWDGEVAPVAQQVPLVMGEMGQNDCGTWFVDRQMAWLDQRGASYLGWTWNTWDCGGGPALIADYSGTPTNLGRAFRDHFRQLAAAPPPPTTTTTTTTNSTTTATTTTKSTTTTSTTTTSTAPVGTGRGLQGEYFDNVDLTNRKLTRTDATVNFKWGFNAPASTMGADTFSVRWTGQVQPRYSGTYTFYTTSDDGVRLWVNGQQVINNWTDHALTENSGTIALVAGQRYDIRLEFYDAYEEAVVTLSWSSPDQPKQIIPQAQLYPPATSTTTTTTTATRLVLYDNAFRNGFTDGTWGYSSRNACDQTTYVSASCSYRIAYTAWGGVNFLAPAGGLDTGPYTRLEWAVKTNGQPLGNFSVLLMDMNGNVLPEVRLSSSDVTAQLANGWVRVSVPVAELNPADVQIREIHLKNGTNQSLPAINIDDVRFVNP